MWFARSNDPRMACCSLIIESQENPEPSHYSKNDEDYVNYKVEMFLSKRQVRELEVKGWEYRDTYYCPLFFTLVYTDGTVKELSLLGRS